MDVPAPIPEIKKDGLEASIKEEADVHTVVLQNIPMEGEDIPIVYNEYSEQNSDGNLQIDTMEEEVITTFIIENTEDSEYDENEGNNEDIIQDIDEDSQVEHYVIEEIDHDYDESMEDGDDISQGYEEDDQYEDQHQYEENHHRYEDEHQYEEDRHEIYEEPPEHYDETLEINTQYTDDSMQYTVEEHEESVDEPDYVETNDEEKDLEVKKEVEVHECDACFKVFKTAAGLKRHITVNHGEDKREDDPLTLQLCACCGEPSDSAHTIGDFKCELCDYLFVQKNCLDRHVSLDHILDGKYICVECKKQFPERKLLVDHMRIHPLKSVKCLGCGREFTRKYHLDRHIGQTGCMGVPRQAFDCRVCQRFFTRKDNLAEHLRGHAGQAKKKKAFICEFCTKEFHGLALLNIHLRTHTGEKPYPCDICPKKFPSSGAMKKHRRMHTGEKPYKCSICDNRFAAKETLNRHVRTHTGEKPHRCEFCGKSFIQASQLRAHIFHHTGENAYTCPHCNRAFNRKLRLTTHIKYMHEGAKPLQCTQCDKTFFRKEDVARHMLSHSGEKPYQCEICSKSFAVKSSLKNHKLTHKKEQPCTCETCGRAFIRQDCLMRHMRARHRDVLEDIVASAEKKRLQQQLLSAVTESANKNKNLAENVIWNELTLTESIKELLTLLVDEECLADFGYPDAQVDKVLDAVIKRCGHKPVSEEDFDYIGRMRENAKLLFTVVIDDEAVKELLNNQTVDEVIMHVLRLAKKQNAAEN